MTVRELKKRKDYEFKRYYNKKQITKELRDYKEDICDIWGFAQLVVGNIGVEYNFCIDDSTDEIENCSAIYKMAYNKNGDYWDTDYCRFFHYEIDFNDRSWKKELENAMCKALIEFSELEIKIKSFINNLTNNDIDLIDKLDNLNGHGQISEEDFELASKEENFKNIEKFVIEILQNGDDLSDEYIDFIINETERLYEDGHCEKDDFTAGLYNCDDLFLFAIEDVLHGDEYLI